MEDTLSHLSTRAEEREIKEERCEAEGQLTNRASERSVSAINREEEEEAGGEERREETSERIREENKLTSLSPFFFLVWTERDSTSLSNWSTCMFSVSIVFWKKDGKKSY